jgi:type I restriction enzyme S subunit
MRLPIPVLPDRWASAPAKALFERVRRPPQATDGIVTAFRDGQVTLRDNRRTEGFTNAIEELGYQGVRRGELVIHSMDGFAGAIGVSADDGKVSPVVHCYKSLESADARYYAYLLRHLALCGYITSLAKGIRERSTAFDAETFGALVLPVPILTEQRAIADYLDAETARIDALIEKRQQIIELLEERLIRMASDLVETGPEVQVRHLTSLITSGPRGWADCVSYEGTPFIRSANLQRESIEIRLDDMAHVTVAPSAEAQRSSVRAGDVLVGITGANTGWVGLVPTELAGAFVSQHVAILRPKIVTPEWLANSLVSNKTRDRLLGGQYGGTKQQLGLENLAELRIRVPPLMEQRARGQQVSRYRSLHNRLIARLGEESRLLQERRQALITAAVTGEVKVPEVAA